MLAWRRSGPGAGKHASFHFLFSLFGTVAEVKPLPSTSSRTETTVQNETLMCSLHHDDQVDCVDLEGFRRLFDA